LRNTGLSRPTFMVVCKITALCCGYAYYGGGVIYGQVTRLQNQAGAQHSQSPMKAEGRAVMGLSYLFLCRIYDIFSLGDETGKHW